MKTVSATDAKNKFGELLDEAATGPVRIDKNGRPVAYVLSPDDFHLAEDVLGLARVQRLITRRDARTLAALRAFSKGDASRQHAIDTLGLRGYGQLLRALRTAELRPPAVPARDHARMVAAFVEVVHG